MGLPIVAAILLRTRERDDSRGDPARYPWAKVSRLIPNRKGEKLLLE